MSQSALLLQLILPILLILILNDFCPKTLSCPAKAAAAAPEDRFGEDESIGSLGPAVSRIHGVFLWPYSPKCPFRQGPQVPTTTLQPALFKPAQNTSDTAEQFAEIAVSMIDTISPFISYA
jgi:hypothetical protein